MSSPPSSAPILRGVSLIAGEVGDRAGEALPAVNPATGAVLEPRYTAATPGDLGRVDAAARAAFQVFGRSSGADRAALLRGIADRIEALGDLLLDRYVSETGLPRTRAESERARTCHQLRLFAEVAESGRWVEARVDPAAPDRRPLPKPELRSLLRPIGPIAIFGPSNFPLAFGVSGGDSAAALAVGCPIIVKAHPLHPGTSELVGAAMVGALQDVGLPAGVFSLVFGGPQVGGQLVELASIRAVAFTGSRAAGQALLARCQRRAVAIPFFGELAAVNPICVLPGALASRPATIAEGLHASVTASAGQLCTKPGLVLYVGGPGADDFLASLNIRFRTGASAPMLSFPMRQAYLDRVRDIQRAPGVTAMVVPPDGVDPTGAGVAAALFHCEASTFRDRLELHEEIFGPTAIIVKCRDLDEMADAVGMLGGQLSASIHEAGDDREAASGLLTALESLAGRIVFNGYPTGVEVSPVMVHGGPWPATTDARFTSVGEAAIRRFVRPICYQNAPAAWLPAELRAIDGTPRHRPEGPPR